MSNTTEAQLQPQNQILEDAAGEGGDTIATFSNYIAPQWAQRCCRNVSDRDEVVAKKKRPTKKTKNEVIEIDCSDGEDGEKVSTEVTTSKIASMKQNHQKEPPSSLSLLSHSSPVCESGLLASVSAPEPRKECLTVIRELAIEGKLSPLQVEGSGLAIQRHCRLFQYNSMGGSDSKNLSSRENGGAGVGNRKRSFVRAGFFLGDGAGIGKGRQIAAVLRDSLSRSLIETNHSSATTTSANFASPSSLSTAKSSKLSQTRTFSKRRHLWLSVSRELIEDARRDLKDVDCHISVFDGAESLISSGNNGNSSGGSNKSSSKLFSSSNQQSGVLFVTYALLVSGKGKRLDDIISWLTYGSTEETFDGCIIFDEAHKAKNLCQDPPTTTGLLVLELQDRLPNARVMYCSATGVSDLKQLGYATRLGLWGEGTNYPTFDSFRSSFEKRGFGAMEMLALEMKQSGSFVARTLSWDGAEFESIRVTLSKEQILIYDQSMKWWDNVKAEINEVLSRPDMNGTPKMLWSQYWSAHQRFAKELAICAKVPFVVSDALNQLESGRSVVIGLQSTGEAGTQAALEEIKSKFILEQNKKAQDVDDLTLPKIISTASAVMAGFVRNHFPVAPLPPDPIKVPPIPPQGFANDHDRMVHQQMKMIAEEQKLLPPPEAIPGLVLKRQKLLDAIENIDLPPCPLDNLIDKLGGIDNVAEMTGRSGRIIRSRSKSSFNFVRRISMPKENKYALSMPPSQEDSDRLNIVEKKKFMDGRKRVAIISDAASTGISLHSASKSTACERRRVHYTIELPWAADKAIQQLGRTHRSGQVTAPVYKMVVTDLGGERRFAAAVAKRMASLGALTKGDRRAASGSDLSEFDIDSRFGRRSLKRLLDCMVPEPPYIPSKGSKAVLDLYLLSSDNDSLKTQGERDRQLHALKKAKASLEAIGLDISSDTRKNNSVKVFLNRIAALTVAEQNLVFGLFTSTMDDIIAEAKATGEYEASVEQVRATSIELSTTPQIIAHDKSNTGAPTKLMTFNVDRGVSCADICKIVYDIISQFSRENQVEVQTSVALSGFYVSKRLIMGRTLILFAKRKVHLTPDDELDTANRIDYDPRGLMVLTRPNTGTNPCEMSTNDLWNKYRLLASVNDLKTLIEGKANIDYATFSSLVQEKYSTCFSLWHQTYNVSNTFHDQIGIAPRWSKLAMVTGSVLHCLPALQKSVSMMMKQADRSLKIMRVEISSDSQQYVGMKFPVDDRALCALITILHNMKNSSSVEGIVDELPSDIQHKSISWITTEPTTMKSFFKPKNAELNRKSSSSCTQVGSKLKRMESKASPAKRKKSTITSFFQKL